MLRRLQLIVFGLLASFAAAAVPLQRYEALMKQQSEELGLYNASDKVVKLTEVNFNETVLDQNHASLVEFYNTYCGHCKRFAPYYKQLADRLHPWREVLMVAAIDCAAEENNALCRQYEVMSYPTLRYMGPGFQPNEKQYGLSIETQNIDEISSALANFIAAENRTTKTIWPNLQPLTDNDNAANIFDGLSNEQKYVVVVYEPENSTIGTETALTLLPWPAVKVRRVSDSSIAEKFKIDGTQYKLSTVDRNGKVVPYKPAEEGAKSYANTIEDVLRAEHLTQVPEKASSTTPKGEAIKAIETQTKEIVAEVHRNKHLVYQADLEMAIRNVLYNEVPKVSNISGDRLLALQRFLTVLKRYNPLGSNGKQLVSKLNEYVVQFNQHITGNEYEIELKRLEQKLQPIFSTNHYVGCTGSRHGLRGFTCSLWQLFHYMTVAAVRNEEAQDPLEVLQAMHGYIKYFFGCTNCAEHFQEMASRRKIWSVPNKDDAVLWLWLAHNEVNQRLAGDSTEDPEFPKIQFPSQTSCSECYKQPVSSSTKLESNWNKDGVLAFLQRIYNPENISRYGVQREELLNQTLDKIRQKRQIANVFSDVDMRMGMLLYGFCIVMMVIAFKLFVFKGYRKKPYGHDMLGKV